MKFFLDGDQWCCVDDNFVNLQESLAGFGDTKEAAHKDLLFNIAFEVTGKVTK